MKAWLVSDAYGYEEGSMVVFAETSGKAKNEALSEFDDSAYTALRAVRAKELDGMEDCEPKDNPWLNEEIRLILVKKYNWRCLEPIRKECEMCIAKNYCGAWEEGFCLGNRFLLKANLPNTNVGKMGGVC